MYSSLRSRPLSTKMQCRRSPMARSRSRAATELSTPPLRASTTWSTPSCFLRRSTVWSTKACGVQSPSQPQMLMTKLCSSCSPSVVWYTSGWNCTAKVMWSRRRKAATGTSLVLAITSMASLGAAMLSPWLIHTWVPARIPSKRWLSPMVLRWARPYSRVLLRSTSAPARLANSWAP